MGFGTSRVQIRWVVGPVDVIPGLMAECQSSVTHMEVVIVLLDPKLQDSGSW